MYHFSIKGWGFVCIKLLISSPKTELKIRISYTFYCLINHQFCPFSIRFQRRMLFFGSVIFNKILQNNLTKSPREIECYYSFLFWKNYHQIVCELDDVLVTIGSSITKKQLLWAKNYKSGSPPFLSLRVWPLAIRQWRVMRWEQI